MAATVLFEVKKKRRGTSTKKSPFPLVFHLGCEDKSSIVAWQFYRGSLRPDGVEVSDAEDMKNLYYMGYFGKGNLSRSAPRFNLDITDPDEEKVMSYRRFQRHQQMRNQASMDTEQQRSNAGSPKIILVRCDDETDDNAAELFSQSPLYLERLRNSRRPHKAALADPTPSNAPSISSTAAGGPQGEESDQDITEVYASSAFGPKIPRGDGSSMEILPTGHKRESSEDIMELFACTVVRNTSGNGSSDASPKVESIKHKRGNNAKDTEAEESDLIENKAVSGTILVECKEDAENTLETVQEESLELTRGYQDASATHDTCSQVKNRGDDVEDIAMESADDVEEQPSSSLQSLEPSLTENDQEVDESLADDSSQPKLVIAEETLNSADVSDSNEIEVVTDTERSKDKVFATEDPWPVKELLQLFFEEAYFLSYGLGCLIVQENDKELGLLELWQKLCALCPNFPARYATYHHFRSKGWVVRAGAKYAADYLLYKDGPPFYHATFSVVVRRACSETLEEDDDHRLRSWTSLASLVRINANAAKTVLLCYVLIPKETDFSTPECLRSFKIQEMIVRRWVTSEERGRKEEAP